MIDFVKSAHRQISGIAFMFNDTPVPIVIIP